MVIPLLHWLPHRIYLLFLLLCTSLPFPEFTGQCPLGAASIWMDDFLQGQGCISDGQRQDLGLLGDRQGLFVAALLAKVLLGIVKSLDWLWTEG